MASEEICYSCLFSLTLNNWTERKEGLCRVHIEFFFLLTFPTSVPTSSLPLTHAHRQPKLRTHTDQMPYTAVWNSLLWAFDKNKQDKAECRYNMVRLRWVCRCLRSSFSMSTPPGAPGPWQKRYDTFEKKLEEGNENNFLHEEEEEGKNKKSLCFTSLSQRQLQGQFMCKRQRHFDTVSFCHWSYQRLLARSCCSKAAAPRLVLISGRVWEAGRWLGLLCVTWCLEAFMIMNVRSSPTKTYQ